MNNEAHINLCFIREKGDQFNQIIDQFLQEIFVQIDFSWTLHEKDVAGGEMILAELTGLSSWKREADIISFLEEHAGEVFWEYLQGYHVLLKPVVKGCVTCGTN